MITPSPNQNYSLSHVSHHHYHVISMAQKTLYILIVNIEEYKWHGALGCLDSQSDLQNHQAT